jgi:hypothetical protein
MQRVAVNVEVGRLLAAPEEVEAHRSKDTIRRAGSLCILVALVALPSTLIGQATDTTLAHAKRGSVYISDSRFGAVGLLAVHYGAALGLSASAAALVGSVTTQTSEFGHVASGVAGDLEVGQRGYKLGIGPCFVAGNPLIGPAALGIGLRYSELRPLGKSSAVRNGEVGRGVELDVAIFLSIRLGTYVVATPGSNRHLSTFSIGFGF